MARPYDLGSVTALISFEAAARHGSFKTAATEINVTPAAVSHQVKALEADLGCALFIRRHRGVELTEQGAFLLVALQRGFEGISDAVAQLRGRPQAVDVTIRVTTAVSALWLTPKITAFWRSHPTVTVSQIVSDVAGHRGTQDISIGYLTESPGPGESRDLFRDRVIAVGTPRFAESHAIGSLADLARVPLVHTSHEAHQWIDWPGWFAALDAPAPTGRGLFVNNHMIALQAAQDDVGAVLAWDGLMTDLLARRRLVRLVAQDIPSTVPFRLVIHPRASAKARLFAGWLLGDASARAAQAG
ncbi:LysR family transcriptional regulator [uncultured Paracoccus sp.]|uniref:LysR family transcriptional regulator n=1 Tax=uncultured Paracoccus sp. TaxID=189685 RepID=UPI0025F565C5|nr:LysR family transcriptional regulator [uncultured Paracoccus sp.]